MRNKNDKTNFAVTGAAALFVGLAGTAQAIPISAHDFQSIIQKSADKTPAVQDGLIFKDPVPVKKAVVVAKPIPKFVASPEDDVIPHAKADLVNLTIPKRPAIVSIPEEGVMPVPSLKMPVISIATGLVLKPVPKPESAPISVPDGGAAGVMLGGAFGGLALLRRKLMS
jgi:hypothetical protein